MKNTFIKLCREGVTEWLFQNENGDEMQHEKEKLKMIYNQLCSGLSEDTHKLLDEFDEGKNLISALYGENSFICGFSLAVRLIIESFTT